MKYVSRFRWKTKFSSSFLFKIFTLFMTCFIFCCGSKNVVFGFGSWNLPQFVSGSYPFHSLSIWRIKFQIFYFQKFILKEKYLFLLYKNNGTWRKFWIKMVNFQSAQPFIDSFTVWIRIRTYSEYGYKSPWIRIPFGSGSTKL